MNTDSDSQMNFDPGDQPLPPALDAAVRQARDMQPTPDALAQLVGRLSRLGAPLEVTVAPARSRKWQITACVAAIAATVLLAFSLWRESRPEPEVPRRQVVELASFPQYSQVTKVSLVDAGFGRIEEDLMEAESRLTESADAIALADLRRDLRTTLEEYPRWGH